MHEEQKRVFIPTSFDEKGKERAGLVTEFLELFELRCVLGETFGGDEVAKGVRERIDDSWFVVPILSRRVKVGENTWIPSEWLWQELAWAKKAGKDCLILVEEGVRFDGGILGNVEYLKFDPNKFTDVLIPLGRQVRALLNRRLMTIGLKRMPIHTYVSDEPLFKECSDDAKLLVLEIRHLAKQQRFDEALTLAKKATGIDPNCWRSWTSLGALHVQLGDVEEGDKLFAQVLRDFANNNKASAAAWHNRAWVQEIKNGCNPSLHALRESSRLYEKALKLDDTRVNTRACLLIIRQMLGEADKAERLLEDSVLYEGFLDALRLEFDERGARTHQVLQTLPKWLRHLMYPIRRNPSGGCDK